MIRSAFRTILSVASLAGGFSTAFAAVTISPPQLDFGPQLQGTSSAPKAITLTNAGPGSVSLSLVGQPGAFQVTHDCGSVAAGASCTATAVFHPPFAGSMNTFLLLDVNPGGGRLSIPLKGEGEFSLVAHYYRSILRREPDAGGRAFWNAEALRVQNVGANGNEVWYAMAMSFFFSPEYQAFNRNDSGFVTDLYQAFFMRAPDGGGLAFWAGQLAGGMPREVLLASFLFSAEFQSFTNGIFGYPPVRAENDVAIDFYRGLLARLPDTGGFLHWLLQFRIAQCNGALAVVQRVEEISSAFMAASEYSNRNRSNGQFVGDLYNAFLRRGGDLGGVQFWIGQLAGGATRESIRQAFLASAEFDGRVQAIVGGGCTTLQQAFGSIPASGGNIALAEGSSLTVAGMTSTGESPAELRMLWPSTPHLADYLNTVAVLDAGPPARFYDLTTNFYATVGDIALSIVVPDDLLASMPAGYEPALFGKAYAEDPDGYRDDFIPLDSAYDPATRRVTATLPAWGCTSLRTGGYPWQCVLALGSLPLVPIQAGLAEKVTEACMPLGSQACTLAAYSPLGGVNGAGTQYTSLFGERTDPIPDPLKPDKKQLHKGVDIKASSLPLVAIGDGYVSKVICSATYGQQVVIVYDDGVSMTSYSHLIPGSIELYDTLGRKIAYQSCIGHTADAPLVRVYPKNSVRVAGGVTVVGFSDSSGKRVKGPHVHVESLKRVGNRYCAVDPKPCITRPAPASYAPPPPPANACCACNFDVYCTAYGPGGCWKCVQSTYAPGFVCRASGLTFDGLCECNPTRYEICTAR